ncbi:MAG: hypothetical protein ACEQSX_18325 [Baekduiaceae bacterium]
MGRDPQLVLAQAALGRGLLTVLKDNAGEILDVDDLRASLLTVHRGMAATYTDQPAIARVHELAAQLLADD